MTSTFGVAPKRPTGRAIKCTPKSVLYTGAFPLDFLRRDEAVRLSDPERGSCELMSPRFGALRIELGEVVERTETGGVAIRQDYHSTGCIGSSHKVAKMELRVFVEVLEDEETSA